MNWIKSHKGAIAAMAVIGLAGLVFIVVWFQPQTIFLDEVVEDTIPTASAEASTATTTTTPDEGDKGGADDEPSDPAADQSPSDQPADGADDVSTEETSQEAQPTYPLTLAEGAFIDLAHSGSGVAKIIELESGSRILRFEDLDVSNGPDLRVILSSSQLVDDDGAYDDGLFLDLGPLKGNKGNQNYEIPPDVDLDEFATAAIWCRRFNVTFNAALITP